MLEKIKESSSHWNYKEYLVQVSLIILSVLIALGIDRCNQNWQDEKRLNEYMTLIHQELKDERRQNLNNLADCKNDVQLLESALTNFASSKDAEMSAALRKVLTVLTRGVFRAFPPLTYERMVASGEGSLIKKIEVKDRLAAYSAFRENYLQYDLKEFDKSTLEVMEKLGKYLDLNCTIQNPTGDLLSCVLDKPTLKQMAPGILGKLYRQCTTREFHIERAQKILEQTLEELDVEIDDQEK